MNTPTLPDRLYRFRSMEYLLGDKYQELERQNIYFARPDQLNDPMEGFRDIVWRGDEIVWTNLFKHYVYCLHTSYSLFHMAGNSRELHEIDIPILGSWDQIWVPAQQRLFDDIWHRFLHLPYMSTLIEALSNRNRRPIRYRELRSYLRVIHSVFLYEIVESYIAHGIMSESNNASQSGEMPAHALLGLTVALILDLERIEIEEEYNAELRNQDVLDNSHRIRHLRKIEHLITQQYGNPVSVEMLHRNSQLVVADFPAVYINEIERLLWPNWYTACFMRNYRNSSVWGHYGDGHRGICLIFEAGKTGGENSLELCQATGDGARTMPFHDVRYENKPGEIDFFTSIGRLSITELMKQWYTDEEGNISKIADDIDSWHKNYRSNFYRDITTKTKDWQYEEECRLILEYKSGIFYEEENRTLSYNFNSLKGIIFGLRTSDEHRLSIIEIIKRKCKKHKRTDFEYYQAYYSPETGDIRKYEIPLP